MISNEERQASGDVDTGRRTTQRYVPYHIAFAYNGLNELDKIIAWLERGFEQRDPKMVFLKAEPKWNNPVALASGSSICIAMQALKGHPKFIKPLAAPTLSGPASDNSRALPTVPA